MGAIQLKTCFKIQRGKKNLSLIFQGQSYWVAEKNANSISQKLNFDNLNSLFSLLLEHIHSNGGV